MKKYYNLTLDLLFILFLYMIDSRLFNWLFIKQDKRKVSDGRVSKVGTRTTRT